MSKLPAISGEKALKAFKKMGFALDHQTGSHVILRHEKPPYRRLTIPNHKELAKGTLRSLIREAGLTVDEFVNLL
ncbi:MAG: type II toxin-antitoxin system HicA family toxin [Deltaproteobacteria bacterium]|nr:type II toxin-antitoxin system HicA family toxin [Deltaproteobacteria bacterium]